MTQHQALGLASFLLLGASSDVAVAEPSHRRLEVRENSCLCGQMANVGCPREEQTAQVMTACMRDLQKGYLSDKSISSFRKVGAHPRKIALHRGFHGS